MGAAAQLLSELVRKAEQNIDALAAKLRSGDHGGAPAGSEPAAPQHALASAVSGSCPQQQQQQHQAPPSVPVDDLINAARHSVQRIAGADLGEPSGWPLLPRLATPSSHGLGTHEPSPCSQVLGGILYL